jgi:hypothetical protein
LILVIIIIKRILIIEGLSGGTHSERCSSSKEPLKDEYKI